MPWSEHSWGFNPDTVKIVKPGESYSEIIPTQGNNAYPQLLAQGDEDVDHFRIDGLKAGHTLVVETLPFFGYYRSTDGTMGPGNTRWTDTRCRLYDADYTRISSERMMMRAARYSQRLASPTISIVGLHTRSRKRMKVPPCGFGFRRGHRLRDPQLQSVDNRDPGRFMYDIYVHQYSTDPTEVEPNNTIGEAMSIGPPGGYNTGWII